MSTEHARLINVYDLLLQRAAFSVEGKAEHEFHYHPMTYFGNTFYEMKDALVVAEMQILKRLGFNVQVSALWDLGELLRVLELTGREDAVEKAWGYLNDA